MAYKVYRRKKDSEKVQLVNDEVYETREEAEIAMRKAQKQQTKDQEVPLPGEFFGPGQTTVPGGKLIEEVGLPTETGEEFFIREV